MTTQTVHLQTFDYGASLTSATLRALTTDALVATADSANEVAADSGLYAIVFDETSVIAAGTYRLRAITSGLSITRYVTLAGTNGEIAQASLVPPAAGAGDASQVTLLAVEDKIDALSVGLSGASPVESTGTTQTVMARLTRIESATSSIGSKPLEYLSNVADGGQLLLTIGDDHETVIANDLPIRVKDAGQTLFNKLTAAGVTLQWSAGQGTTPNLITGTVSTPTHSNGITTIVVQVPNTPSPAGANIFAPFHWQLQRTIGGKRQRMLKGSLKLEPDMIGG